MREEVTTPEGFPDLSPGRSECSGVLPVRATRCGRQRRLARMMSFMSSRSGLEVNMPVYRYSSTARMQLLLV